MRKFNLNFLLICDNAFIGERGKLSVIGIFENLTFKKLPARHLSLTVVGNVTLNDPISRNITVSLDLIRKPKEKIDIKFPEVTIRPKGKSFKKGNKLGFIVTIGNIPFEKVGNYAFRAFLNGEEVGEALLKVGVKK